MKSLLKKVIQFLLPLIIVITIIWFSDPYKLLYKYDDYTTKNFTLNRHYVTTQYFLDNYEIEKYNAFIFGNSRTLAFKTTDWLNFISDISPYHFDATGESINGIKNKIILVDNSSSDLSHAIVLLDRMIFLEPENYDNHLFRQHYQATNESKLILYAYVLKSFLNYRFIIYYTDYLTSGLISKLSNAIPKYFVYEKVTNDIIMAEWEKQIIENEDEFFEKYDDYFLPRSENEVHLPAVINGSHIEDLKIIKGIFDKHKTDFKIIVGPDYRLIKFDSVDLKILKEIFGTERVYDFSGKNRYSINKRNFYDGSHYRPFIGRMIFDEVYPRNDK